MGEMENQVKKGWSVKQMLGFFVFYLSLGTWAFTLDWANQNIFSDNITITHFYHAFVILVVIIGTGAFVFMLWKMLLWIGLGVKTWKRGDM